VRLGQITPYEPVRRSRWHPEIGDGRALPGEIGVEALVADDVLIRPIREADRPLWEPLWQAYLDFYRADLTGEVTRSTWRSLCDPTSAVHGRVAERGRELVGLAHFILHPTTWSTGPTCYLEDLFVVRGARGSGVARQLIEAGYALADSAGAEVVYWITQEYNAPARSLYDTVAHRTSFIVYQR
jgi:GNAT superfamily N-acetyltransferase